MRRSGSAAPYRGGQRACYGSRRQFAHGDFTIVWHHFRPWVMSRQQLFDGRDRHIFFQFNGKCLTVAAQCANANTQTINRNGGASAENFVGFSLAFPLFTALAVIQLFVDPWNQTASGTPKLSTGSSPLRERWVTLRSISRMADAGSASSAATWP